MQSSTCPSLREILGRGPAVKVRRRQLRLSIRRLFHDESANQYRPRAVSCRSLSSLVTINTAVRLSIKSSPTGRPRAHLVRRTLSGGCFLFGAQKRSATGVHSAINTLLATPILPRADTFVSCRRSRRKRKRARVYRADPPRS